MLMDVLILMAGKGSRFKDLHPDKPKPLVPLHGEPMVRWVVENLRFEKNQRYLFVCLKEHVEKFRLHDLFSFWDINFEIIIAPEVTEGAACSALLATPFLSEKELVIANSDQLVLFNKNDFLLSARSFDGCILSMSATGSKWSYIKTNEDDLVMEVKEKVEISSTGTVGVYYFRSGNLFIESAQSMIKANERHNNEFYLAPCYNSAIKNGATIGHYNVGRVGSEMIGLGTSEDFSNFEKEPRSLNIKKDIFG
jgi:NDP-sugar pyrophosphorylase family protein